MTYAFRYLPPGLSSVQVAAGARPEYLQEVDFNSPQFRRTFPIVVYAVIGVGLLMIFVATFLVALGFGE